MKALDKKLLHEFVKAAGDRLEGDWVLLGGTLLPFLGVEYRVTTDIDLVGIGKKGNDQTLELMSIAEDLGLPIESINQAAAYFLMKLQPFDDHLILLHEGKKAKIFRPDLYLFLMLKLGRVSESDFTDCLEMIKRESSLSKKDFASIHTRIEAELKKECTQEKTLRLNKLKAALTQSGS